MSNRPADGAPSPQEPLSNATRTMMAYWLGEIDRGRSPTSGSDRDAFFACAKAVWSSLRAVERERDALRDAATAMVVKLDAIAPHMTDQAVFMHVHGMAYDGPNYAEELKALRALSPGAATTPPQTET